MDERELPSDSDESDEDYVPSGADSNPQSEEESEGDEADDLGDSDAEEEEDKSNGKRKRGSKSAKKKRTKRIRKKELPLKKVDENDIEKNEEKCLLTEEEEKKKADSLWSDFLKDTGTVCKNKDEPPASIVSAKAESVEPNHIKKQEKENKVTITKVYEFAGEEVKVTKEVSVDSVEARTAVTVEPASSANATAAGEPRGRGTGRGRGGISSVLGLIGSKKQKLGTLEKSKLDWDRFKKAEGLEEEITKHNRGRDGYLDKIDFLQRTDIRQFELEKQLRTSRRSTR